MEDNILFRQDEDVNLLIPLATGGITQFQVINIIRVRGL